MHQNSHLELAVQNYQRKNNIIWLRKNPSRNLNELELKCRNLCHQMRRLMWSTMWLSRSSSRPNPLPPMQIFLCRPLWLISWAMGIMRLQSKRTHQLKSRIKMWLSRIIWQVRQRSHQLILRMVSQMNKFQWYKWTRCSQICWTRHHRSGLAHLANNSNRLTSINGEMTLPLVRWLQSTFRRTTQATECKGHAQALVVKLSRKLKTNQNFWILKLDWTTKCSSMPITITIN